MISTLAIQKQIIVGFGFLGLLAIIPCGFGIISLRKSTDHFIDHVGSITTRSRLVNKIRAAIDRRASAVERVIRSEPTGQTWVDYIDVLLAHEEVSELIVELQKATKATADRSFVVKEALQRIVDAESRYAPLNLKITDSAIRRTGKEPTDKLLEECQPLLKALISAVRDYQDHADRRSAERLRFLLGQSARNRNILLCTAIIALVSAASFAWAINRSLDNLSASTPAGNPSTRK